jgi:hypothetical protein
MATINLLSTKTCGFDRYIMFKPLPYKDIRNTNNEIPPAKTIDQNKQIMQNKPNFKKPKMNLKLYKIRSYKEMLTFGHRKNKPNSNPILKQTCAREACPCESRERVSKISRPNLHHRSKTQGLLVSLRDLFFNRLAVYFFNGTHAMKMSAVMFFVVLHSSSGSSPEE